MLLCVLQCDGTAVTAVHGVKVNAVGFGKSPYLVQVIAADDTTSGETYSELAAVGVIACPCAGVATIPWAAMFKNYKAGCVGAEVDVGSVHDVLRLFVVVRSVEYTMTKKVPAVNTFFLFFFVYSRRMKYFKDSEFSCRCGCGMSIKDMDTGLLEKLEEARELAGVPFIVSSGCRCAQHNATCGGVKASAHTRGMAVDLRCVSSADRFAMLRALFAVGFRRVELAPTWIHVDVDDSKPQDVAFYKKGGKY